MHIEVKCRGNAAGRTPPDGKNEGNGVHGISRANRESETQEGRVTQDSYFQRSTLVP